jgi:hypothetical protein
VVGDGADMPLRSAGGHHHIIADRGFAGEIDGDAVLGFDVFKTGEDQAERLLGVWPRPGDGFGRTTRRPRECKFGQGVLSFLLVALAPTASARGIVTKIVILCGHFQPFAGLRRRRAARSAVDESGDLSPCR